MADIGKSILFVTAKSILHNRLHVYKEWGTERLGPSVFSFPLNRSLITLHFIYLSLK